MNQSQQAAIEQILASCDRVTAPEDAAGTGKTTSLAVVRDTAELESYRVEGFAPTSRAAQKLVDARIESSTLYWFSVVPAGGEERCRTCLVSKMYSSPNR
jgi:hypothetical protein